jgi:hypothetical protein
VFVGLFNGHNVHKSNGVSVVSSNFSINLIINLLKRIYKTIIVNFFIIIKILVSTYTYINIMYFESSFFIVKDHLDFSEVQGILKSVSRK